MVAVVPKPFGMHSIIEQFTMSAPKLHVHVHRRGTKPA